MKTIGTCKECKWWNKENQNYLGSPLIERDCHKIGYGIEGIDGIVETGENNFMTGADFGCIHWETKHKPLDNYPTKTAQDLEIADLKRENDAAFQRIQELSNALVNLGYDPTAKKTGVENNYDERWLPWTDQFPKIGEHIGDGWYCVEGKRDYKGNRSIKVRKYKPIE